MSLAGVSPKEFCDTKGENTWLKGKYLFARIDDDGCLILTLKNQVLSEWKNTFFELHVLQCVLGDSRNIGIELYYSKDFMDYMLDADTCGYEISEDYTLVVESYDDNGWYYPVIIPACIKMQMLEGKKCSDITVEFIELDSDGNIVEKIVYPESFK
jgi:hypothetical protein